LLYGISQRVLFPGLPARQYLELLFECSAQILQWREKDLPAEENRRLIRCGVELAGLSHKLFLVNSCVKMAVEEGAQGVHLPSDQALEPVVLLREASGSRFLVGKSTHTIGEALQAEDQGADYVLLSPIRAPFSKSTSRETLGLEGLALAAQQLRIPVFALGGISSQDLASIGKVGAAGIAGITWVRIELESLLAKGRS